MSIRTLCSSLQTEDLNVYLYNQTENGFNVGKLCLWKNFANWLMPIHSTRGFRRPVEFFSVIIKSKTPSWLKLNRNMERNSKKFKSSHGALASVDASSCNWKELHNICKNTGHMTFKYPEMKKANLDGVNSFNQLTESILEKLVIGKHYKICIYRLGIHAPINFLSETWCGIHHIIKSYILKSRNRRRVSY